MYRMVVAIKTSDEILTSEEDINEIIRLLHVQPNLRLTERFRRDLREQRYQTFEDVFANWNYGYYDYSEDEEERVKDFDENHRLEIVSQQRKPCVNFCLAVSFHFIVLANFFYCVWDSFGILVENAKFDYLYLKDVYQCLNIIPSQDYISHFIGIFHAITCVAVFHAKTLQTANLCWAFLAGTILHLCFKFTQVLHEQRLTFDEQRRGFKHWRSVQLGVISAVAILSIIIVLQRYYDLTARFQKRSHKFVTQTYEGRQLNDRIIYRNVSSFVQRKYVLRSCTALQIYRTVHKILLYKRKVKKGEGKEVDDDLFQQDILAAVQALKDVEGFKGMDMMRELKRRNFQSWNEESEVILEQFKRKKMADMQSQIGSSEHPATDLDKQTVLNTESNAKGALQK